MQPINAVQPGFREFTGRQVQDIIDRLNLITNGIQVLEEDGNFTLRLEHFGCLVLTGDATITVPPDTAFYKLMNYRVEVCASDATPPVFAAGDGVTIESQDGLLSLSGQWTGATLTRIGENRWLLVGCLA